MSNMSTEDGFYLLRESMLTGRLHKMKLPMDEITFTLAESRWKNGMLIQDAFPTLNADQREFIKTGITPEEWDAAFLPSDS